MTIIELSQAYHTIHANRIDLDRRITALPNTDILGKDRLLLEMQFVLANLVNTERLLASTHATDMSEVRAKAEVLILTNDLDAITALALSLAKDVVRIA